MNVGPDGSLCRITSSTSAVSNIKIVKVSENENDAPEYKLVFVGEEETDNESLSENSDQEAFEKEVLDLINVKLSTENNEKDKDVKVQENIEESKPEKEEFHKRTTSGRFRSQNIHRSHKNYNSFGKRNFNSYGNVTKPYNQSKANAYSPDIDPWLHPPPNLMLPVYGIFQQHPSGAEPMLSNSVNPNYVGLLGDAPSSHYHQRNFQSSYQNTPYRPSQNFGQGDYSSNYQMAQGQTGRPSRPKEPAGGYRDKQNRQGSSPPVNYHNKHWKNTNESKFWKRNRNNSPQDRRNQKSSFSYRT